MTDRQLKFVKAFIFCGNASKAARLAGYSLNGVNRQGYYLRQRLHFEILWFSLPEAERRMFAASRYQTP